MTQRGPQHAVHADVAYRDGSALRSAIEDARARERQLPARWVRGWAICGGCRQSATSSYLGHVCCVRCQAVLS